MSTNPVAEVQDPESQLEAVFAKRFGEDKPQAPEEDDDVQEPEAQAEEQPEADAEEPDEGQPDSAADELDEVELDGKKHRVPKEVKAAVLRQEDYTKKTQEVANLRRIVEDRQHYVEARETIMASAFDKAAELQAMKSQMSQFDKADWNQLFTSDPAEAAKLAFFRQQLSDQIGLKQREVDAIVANAQAASQAHEAKQMELGQAELERRLGKIGQEDRQTMLALAHELGFDKRDLMSPAAVHALALAAKAKRIGDARPQDKRIAQAKPFTAPAARSSVLTGEAAKADKLKAAMRKERTAQSTEDYLAQLIASKRKR